MKKYKELREQRDARKQAWRDEVFVRKCSLTGDPIEYTHGHLWDMGEGLRREERFMNGVGYIATAFLLAILVAITHLLLQSILEEVPLLHLFYAAIYMMGGISVGSFLAGVVLMISGRRKIGKNDD